MKTCNTCKHWEIGGSCEKIVNVLNVQLSDGEKIFAEKIETKADFGCTLWEKEQNI